MGNFTKKYIRPFHPENTLTLSWDAGYRNVSVIDGDRLVHQFEQAGQFTKGITLQDEKLGKIKLKFTDTRPLQLEMRVNGKKYKPGKKGKQEVDLSGAIAVYWAMMAFTAIILLFGIYVSAVLTNLLGNFVGLGILAGMTGIYLFSALMMSFKKHWAFFVGFGYMVLSTGWYTLSAIEIGFDPLVFLLLFIRYILLIYLVLNIRKVTYAMKLTEAQEKQDIIDESI